MLSILYFSKNIRTPTTLPCQWLNIAINTVRLKSNGSSSDSDSDSNSNSNAQRKSQGWSKQVNSSKSDVEVNDEMNKLIDNLFAKQVSKNKDVRISVRNEDKKMEEQLMKLTEALTTTVGGQKEEVLKALLENFGKGRNFNMMKERMKIAELKKTIEKRHGPYSKLGSNYTNATKYKERLHETPTSTYKTRSRHSQMESYTEYPAKRVSHIQTCLEEWSRKSANTKKDYMGFKAESIRRAEDPYRPLPKVKKEYPPIFDNIQMSPSNVPELKTWNLCEQKELKLLGTSYPQNAFQEMIQWTEEGKLWKFPIDNEQGMEEEQNVHFSEHVFLERHLAGWCPVKGPIRHFMELVCIGLSKNPYMTVQEKYGHIMWYKDYFDSKKDLLKELGLADIPPINAGTEIEPQ